ncbi:MAG: TetR/AcrR family transcriptional regulator [Proteobacteria bacterium]|jgi:AcrR family transcriptional regulator|nr:TetR/AcrR family transcriptional regulator [Pseudomonadota bacterium]
MGKPAKDSTDTKRKIMETAFELFGRFGYEGTSIRHIAQECGVNLAAVNYHFHNKENLFWEIMIETYREADQDLAQMKRSSKNTLEMSLQIYDYFMRESLAVRNTMKMMLTEGIGHPSSAEALEVLNDPFGPPGGGHLAERLQADVGYCLNREGMIWGVKTIFGAIMHWTLICCHGEDRGEEDPLMTPAQFRKDVEYLVEATLMFLRSNQKRFEEKS